MDNNPDKILIIFLKYPQPGLVKTRLATDIGKEKAASLYKKFTELIIEQVTSDDYHLFIFYSPLDKREEIINWLGKDLEFYPQQGNNLGRRMQKAFKFAFARGAKNVAIIGTDSPLINKHMILEAFKKLEAAEAVIGPCLDGGYYLLGLNKFKDDIFEGMAWSSDRVYNQTIAKLRNLDFKFVVLEEQVDVDDIEDIKLLKSKLEKDQSSGAKSLRELLTGCTPEL